MDVRHRLAGMIIVLVAFAASITSYIALDHFYGREYTTTSTRTLVIENSGQQVQIEGAKFCVFDADYVSSENNYRLSISPAPGYENQTLPPEGPNFLGGETPPWMIDVPGTAYEQAQETGNPVTVSDTTTTETKPINALPIAASLGIAISLITFGVWVGYRHTWGDATSTLLEHGLHDMTVRDVEIVGQIMELKEFTIPQLIKETRASKLTVWRTVQKLVKNGIVRPTDQTKPAANGLGGRGKPSVVYKYVGVKEKGEGRL